MPGFSVGGRAALVTGGGSGIGLCCVELLLSKGCHVVVADLGLRPEAHALLEAKPAPGHGRAIFCKTDVTDWAQLEAAVACGAREFGRIDVFVPSAGVYEPPWSSFWVPPGSAGSADARTANRYRSLDVNLTHAVRLTQLALAHLLSTGSAGAVVLVSSIAAQEIGPLTPLYNASKAAVSSLARSLGFVEAAAGVRVAAVAPGLVLTPLWTEDPDKMAFVDQSRDEWVTPQEVAAAVVALVEADEHAGQNIGPGTVLEVGKGSARVVNALNDPGPSGPGLGATGRGTSIDELIQLLKSGQWGG